MTGFIPDHLQTQVMATARRMGKTTAIVKAWRKYRQEHPHDEVLLITFNPARAMDLRASFEMTKDERKSVVVAGVIVESPRGRSMHRRAPILFVDDAELVLADLLGGHPLAMTMTASVVDTPFYVPPTTSVEWTPPRHNFTVEVAFEDAPQADETAGAPRQENPPMRD